MLLCMLKFSKGICISCTIEKITGSEQRWRGERTVNDVYKKIGTPKWIALFILGAISIGLSTEEVKAAPPTITTDAVTSITANSASSGGNVTDAGSSPVTSRGVCWNTAGTPTLADSCTADGSGTGTFPIFKL